MNKNNIKLAKGLILLCYLLYKMEDLLPYAPIRLWTRQSA